MIRDRFAINFKFYGIVDRYDMGTYFSFDRFVKIFFPPGSALFWRNYHRMMSIMYIPWCWMGNSVDIW